MADPFQARTEDFLEWFINQEGNSINSTLELFDLREQGRGRGLGIADPTQQMKPTSYF